MDRDLTANEKKEIDSQVEKIHDLLICESKRLDPQLIKQAKEEKAKLISLFDGHSPIYVEERPNAYMHDPMFPWFTITTWIGRFDIGWRKRVIVIDWNATKLETTAEKIFPDEDVTKSGRLIHAYGYEKAQEYINTIFAHCSEGLKNG
jgi:hypothetical protein